MDRLEGIEIREGAAIPEKQVKELFAALGWSRYDAFLPGLLRDSTFVVSAWDEARMVGLARVVSDRVYASMLHHVGVHPDYRRRGLGGALVGRCVQQFANTHFLLTTDDPTDSSFYSRFGFEPIANAMFRRRSEPQ